MFWRRHAAYWESSVVHTTVSCVRDAISTQSRWYNVIHRYIASIWEQCTDEWSAVGLWSCVAYKEQQQQWTLSSFRKTQEETTHQEMRYPNVTSLYFATSLAFNAPDADGRVPWDDLHKILYGGQRRAKVRTLQTTDGFVIANTGT